MYTGTSSSTTEMYSASTTTCHKCSAKHRSSLQYFRLGCDDCFSYWIWMRRWNIIMWAEIQLHTTLQLILLQLSPTLETLATVPFSATVWWQPSFSKASFSNVLRYISGFSFLSNWCIDWIHTNAYSFTQVSHHSFPTKFNFSYSNISRPVKFWVKSCRSLSFQLFTAQR